MTDPYRVLGVSRNASDDEIKRAYRTLSRKYHPDANINNPNKAQAEEKFKEVQQAYDQIMKEKQQGSTYDGFGYGGSGETWAPGAPGANTRTATEARVVTADRAVTRTSRRSLWRCVRRPITWLTVIIGRR